MGRRSLPAARAPRDGSLALQSFLPLLRTSLATISANTPTVQAGRTRYGYGPLAYD